MTSLRGSYGKSSDVRLEISTARHNLEAILVYAITQLAMWLSAPHLDNGPGDMDIDEQVPESRKDRPKERKASRPSLTLTDRLRRGMTGEVATDLQSLLNKAKSIFIKCEGVLETNAVDLTQVLSNFLHERIVIPT
jgi:nuclear pore complex protein Nup188